MRFNPLIRPSGTLSFREKTIPERDNNAKLYKKQRDIRQDFIFLS